MVSSAPAGVSWQGDCVSSGRSLVRPQAHQLYQLAMCLTKLASSLGSYVYSGAGLSQRLLSCGSRELALRRRSLGFSRVWQKLKYGTKYYAQPLRFPSATAPENNEETGTWAWCRCWLATLSLFRCMLWYICTITDASAQKWFQYMCSYGMYEQKFQWWFHSDQVHVWDNAANVEGVQSPSLQLSRPPCHLRWVLLGDQIQLGGFANKIVNQWIFDFVLVRANYHTTIIHLMDSLMDSHVAFQCFLPRDANMSINRMVSEGDSISTQTCFSQNRAVSVTTEVVHLESILDMSIELIECGCK